MRKPSCAMIICAVGTGVLLPCYLNCSGSGMQVSNFESTQLSYQSEGSASLFQNAKPVQSFINSMGVNTHLDKQGLFNEVTKLHYLGIHNVRDNFSQFSSTSPGTPSLDNDGIPLADDYAALAAAGISFNVLSSDQYINSHDRDYKQGSSSVIGDAEYLFKFTYKPYSNSNTIKHALSSVEGMNEVNGFCFIWQGSHCYPAPQAPSLPAPATYHPPVNVICPSLQPTLSQLSQVPYDGSWDWNPACCPPGTIGKTCNPEDFFVSSAKAGWGNAPQGPQALARMQAIYTALKSATDGLQNVPMYDMTYAAGLANANELGLKQITGIGAGRADYANVHSYNNNAGYIKNGGQPHDELLESLALLYPSMVTNTSTTTVNPGASIVGNAVITETGLVQSGQVQSQTLLAIANINIWLDAYAEGFHQTFIYTLNDESLAAEGFYNANSCLQSDCTNTKSADFLATANPVATVTHNLTSLLADKDSNGNDVAPISSPGGLNYSITALTPVAQGGYLESLGWGPTNVISIPSKNDVHSLLLQKSNGVYDLVVWVENAAWTPYSANAVAISTSGVKTVTKDGSGYKLPPPPLNTGDVAPVSNPMTVNLGQSFATITLYDPYSGMDPIQQWYDSSSINFGLYNHAMIVELSTVPTTTKLKLVQASRPNAAVLAKIPLKFLREFSMVAGQTLNFDGGSLSLGTDCVFRVTDAAIPTPHLLRSWGNPIKSGSCSLQLLDNGNLVLQQGSTTLASNTAATITGEVINNYILLNFQESPYFQVFNSADKPLWSLPSN